VSLPLQTVSPLREVEVTAVADATLHQLLQGEQDFGGCVQRDGKNYVLYNKDVPLPPVIMAIKL